MAQPSGGLSWGDFTDHSIQSAARGLFVLLDAGSDSVDFPAFLTLLLACAADGDWAAPPALLRNPR